ncbi:MAG TPA: FIST C-terminal domain-containing protein [Azospira sp.]|nr:FIST C-terminal domain-containing protein [Azospira sp.]
MTAATALVSGNDPLPQLAENAVREALAKLQAAGHSHATGVLLYLTQDFARHLQPALLAASRAAACTQVAGTVAAGVFTESGWVLDRPAAAAMVFGGKLSLRPGRPGTEPLLSLASASALPPEWATPDSLRFGALHLDALASQPGPVWLQGRATPDHRCSLSLDGTHGSVGLSCGLKLLGSPLPVGEVEGHDLHTLGGQKALDVLQRVLPADQRERRSLHHITAVVADPGQALERPESPHCRLLPVVAASPEGAITLADRVSPGQTLAWAIRQPLAAEQDMRDSLAALAEAQPTPDLALMFSCIGRGPYFYGGEDRDLLVLRERFPELPLLGLYGSGQIAPLNGGRLLHNSVVTALFSEI